MKRTRSSRRHHYSARNAASLAALALLVAMLSYGGSCVYTAPPSENLEIRTWYDLDAVRDNLNGNHKLMNDLDSTTSGHDQLAGVTANEGKGWQPIGFHPWLGSTAYEGFWGAFDGQGHEIRDLYINRPGERWVGLFGDIEPGGLIQDIGVMNATVIGDEYVGGLLAVTDGAVSNCYCSGKVTGNKDVGGLVGVNNHGTVYNSYFTGNVIGNLQVGGLAGRNNGTVRDSYSTGNVTGESHVGGLLGCQSVGIVSNSYSTGSVTGNSRVGGLVGTNYSGPVTNSFWDIETSGQATSDGGTGKTTAEMQHITTFSIEGWNIIAVALNETNSAYIWNTVNNVTYPFLSWQS